MDETLNSVNAEQTPVVEGQEETVTGEGNAVVAEQQTVETEVKPEQSPEENAHWKALRLEEKQRAEKAAEDRVYANLATQNGWKKPDGTPVKTRADYEEAKSAQDKFDALVSQGVDPEAAQIRVENELLKARITEQLTASQRTAKQTAEYNAFLDYFQAENGRALTEADVAEIKKAGLVEKARAEGVSLKYIYAEYRTQQLKEKLKGIETGQKTMEANASNAATSTGSVTGQGQADNSVLTEEMIASMTPKQLAKRWDAVKKFYNMK